MSFFGLPCRLAIYRPGLSKLPDVTEAGRQLQEILHIGFDVHQPVLEGLEDFSRETAHRMASIRIVDPSGKLSGTPLPPETDYECRALRGETSVFVAVYEGRRLQQIAFELLGDAVRDFSIASVVFTDRLFGTVSAGRVHLRMVLFGAPTLISVPGLVKAPARPREYYLKRDSLSEALGRDLSASSSLKSLGNRVLSETDPRMTEVATGLLAQTVFFHIHGNPFCDNPGCRLYNAHWQEELISSQVDGSFCEEHSREIEELIRKNGTT